MLWQASTRTIHRETPEISAMAFELSDHKCVQPMDTGRRSMQKKTTINVTIGINYELGIQQPEREFKINI